MSNSTDHGRHSKNWRRSAGLFASVVTTSALCLGSAAIGGEDDAAVTGGITRSPIKHVIILIGENRGFDHTFATYRPKGEGQTISNLLSKGIVRADGSPGPNYALAQQYSVTSQPLYYIGAPKAAKTPYNNTTNPMPQPTSSPARFRTSGPSSSGS